MNIVYAATRNLYPWLRLAILSLLDHNSPAMIYVLAEDDALPFEIDAPHKVINVSEQQYFDMNGPNAKSIYTYMAMMRLCYVDLMPECDKVIQLDVDTIVCDDLTPLWKIDLTGKWFSACEEYTARYKPYGPHYYNIGVCVFNLAQLRADGIVPLMIYDLNNRPYYCIEQDMLNKYGVPDKVVPFGVERIRYNESFCCGYTSDPAIVHFAGRSDWMTNPNHFRREYLEKYLAR